MDPWGERAWGEGDVQIREAGEIAFESDTVVGYTLTPLASLGTLSRGRERGIGNKSLLKNW